MVLTEYNLLANRDSRRRVSRHNQHEGRFLFDPPRAPARLYSITGAPRRAFRGSAGRRRTVSSTSVVGDAETAVDGPLDLAWRWRRQDSTAEPRRAAVLH